MVLEEIMLTEVTETQKNKHYIFYLICDSKPKSSDVSVGPRTTSETKKITGEAKLLFLVGFIEGDH